MSVGILLYLEVSQVAARIWRYLGESGCICWWFAAFEGKWCSSKYLEVSGVIWRYLVVAASIWRYLGVSGDI